MRVNIILTCDSSKPDHYMLCRLADKFESQTVRLDGPRYESHYNRLGERDWEKLIALLFKTGHLYKSLLGFRMEYADAAIASRLVSAKRG